MLGGEKVRHLLQIRIAEIFQQKVHGRIFPPVVLEGEQLVVEIAGRLAAEPREVDVDGALASAAVARGTGLDPGGHGVRRLREALSASGKSLKREPQSQPDANISQWHCIPNAA